MPLIGLESDSTTPNLTSHLRQSPTEGAAQSGAHATEPRRLDPDLLMLVERWAALPEALRAGIVAMVRAALAVHPERSQL